MRYHRTIRGRIPFTAEEELIANKEEELWIEHSKTSDDINKREALILAKIREIAEIELKKEGKIDFSGKLVEQIEK
jgi:hypothetical protein